jgi:GntR family transcriptional regulator
LSARPREQAPGREDRRPTARWLLDEISAFIRSAGLEQGDRLPSETELAARFGVARGSVREALKLLEQDGLLDVRHGRGRFVSGLGRRSVSSPVTSFESVTEMAEGRGLALETHVLSVERAPATDDEATALELDPGAEVVRLRRLRLADGEGVLYSSNVFAASLLAGRQLDADEFSGSLVEWLARAGRPPVSSAAQIRATELPDDVARSSEALAGHAWLLVSELCIDGAAAPVLLSLDYHRGDIFSFQVLRRRTCQTN